MSDFDIGKAIDQLKYIKYLGKEEGYPLDCRPPRWDGLAVEAANFVFGRNTVTHILESYKRAHVTLPALYSDVLQYDLKRKERPVDDPVYVAAFQSVREQFVPETKLIPLTTGAVTTLEDVPRDKSPGLPWTRLGFKNKGDVMRDDKALNKMRSEWHAIGEGRFMNLPKTQVFVRSQISRRDEDDKIRATWGYPLTVFLEEARYVYPYLDNLKKRTKDYPLGYGVEMINGGMGYIDEMYSRCGGDKRACMLDWKRFDKKIPAWLIRDVFLILKESFVDDKVIDAEGNVWEVNPVLTRRRWIRMVNYFINTPFNMPDGRSFKKNGGVPSGSGWTNIIDSIVNAIVTRYCCYHISGSFPPYDIFLGDDSFLMVEGDFDLEKFASVADEAFGFTLNLKKSYTTTTRSNCQFLGFYNYHGQPFRNMDFILASFIYPEKQDERSYEFTGARAIGQMWSTMHAQNAKTWYRVVKYVEDKGNLSGSWFRDYMSERPSRLKFLHIYGINLQNVIKSSEKPFDHYFSRVIPRSNCNRRKPTRRTTCICDLYYRFYDDPIFLEEEILESEDPLISNSLLED